MLIWIAAISATFLPLLHLHSGLRRALNQKSVYLTFTVSLFWPNLVNTRLTQIAAPSGYKAFLSPGSWLLLLVLGSPSVVSLLAFLASASHYLEANFFSDPPDWGRGI